MLSALKLGRLVPSIKNKFNKNLMNPLRSVAVQGTKKRSKKKRGRHKRPEGTVLWDPALCLRCNECVASCPDMALHSILLEETAGMSFDTIASAVPDRHFRIQVDPSSCSKCGDCVEACKEHALTLTEDPKDVSTQQTFFSSIKTEAQSQASSADSTTIAMIARAAELGVETVWDRFRHQHPSCEHGRVGTCCRVCAMGPCRITRKGKQGVCGATADTIVARNLLRTIAAGAAAHSDHAREVITFLKRAGKNHSRDHHEPTIADPDKLRTVAEEFGIDTEKKDELEIATEVAVFARGQFSTSSPLKFVNTRAPSSRRKRWEMLDLVPSGIDCEIVRALHQTNVGTDALPTSLLTTGLRVSLADGVGGSMLATELTDCLLGTPSPREFTANLGVLKEDSVNIVVHGHEPLMSQMVLKASQDALLVDRVKQLGAKGIQLSGMCCTGHEVLRRAGIPMLGNFLQQELVLVTGAVEAMVVDVQCILPALPATVACFHTRFISTSPKARFPGAEHFEFSHEQPYTSAKRIVEAAVENFANRNPDKVFIPDSSAHGIAGFSAEQLLPLAGPLLEAIGNGTIKGVVGVLGCNNPRVKHDASHVRLTQELIARNILVLATGCSATASAKQGLLSLEGGKQAGEKLSKFCSAAQLPPVLHMGSCVDNSRILTVLFALAKKLNVDVSDLPVAGAAPEWMSEKAVAIASYFLASGVFTVLGVAPPVFGSEAVTTVLTTGLEESLGGRLDVVADVETAANKIEEHIIAKRKVLNLAV